MRYQAILTSLRSHYEANVAERDSPELEPWRARERGFFLELLAEFGAQALLELGSGPGRDGAFFRDNSLQIIFTDLSPARIASCRDKRLEAVNMDFLNLNFGGRTFDDISALNCLPHKRHLSRLACRVWARPGAPGAEGLSFLFHLASQLLGALYCVWLGKQLDAMLRGKEKLTDRGG